jgi:hypothetical protein
MHNCRPHELLLLLTLFLTVSMTITATTTMLKKGTIEMQLYPSHFKLCKAAAQQLPHFHDVAIQRHTLQRQTMHEHVRHRLCCSTDCANRVARQLFWQA